MGAGIESIGIFQNKDGSIQSSLELIHNAILDCIVNSEHCRTDVEVLINVSPYRDKYFVEPAFATFVQDKSGINHDIENANGPKTFAFDLMNGGMGFFNGCQVLNSIIMSDKIKTGMVVCGDVIDFPINQDGATPGFSLTGAAMLLDNKNNNGAGFSSFYNKQFFDYQEAYKSYGFYDNGWLSVIFKKDSELQSIYIKAISVAVHEYLNQIGKEMDDFDLIFPPQISHYFVSELMSVLECDERKYVDITRDDGDLFNASIPMSIQYAIESGSVSTGQTGLIIDVASGIQVGCAVYKF